MDWEDLEMEVLETSMSILGNRSDPPSQKEGVRNKDTIRKAKRSRRYPEVVHFTGLSLRMRHPRRKAVSDSQ